MVLYLSFGIVNFICEKNHGFSAVEVGLTFLGLFVGIIVAILSRDSGVEFGSGLVNGVEVLSLSTADRPATGDTCRCRLVASNMHDHFDFYRGISLMR